MTDAERIIRLRAMLVERLQECCPEIAEVFKGGDPLICEDCIRGWNELAEITPPGTQDNQ